MLTAASSFYFFAFLTLLLAGIVILAKNPIYSIISLIGVFFCLTAHYLMLNAQFLAAVNIIVYAGAIMVLFLFVIMFLNLNQDTEPQKPALAKVSAAIAGGLLLLVLVAALHKVQPAGYGENFDSQVGMVNRLGMTLYQDYSLPFELASILLLTALVGSVMLGKRETGERNF